MTSRSAPPPVAAAGRACHRSCRKIVIDCGDDRDHAAGAVASCRALLNRERAILEFNRRVLAQARRDDVPLLERLRYVCIVSSNLDEFFEVRFADCLEASRRPDSGTTAGRHRGARRRGARARRRAVRGLQRRGDAGARRATASASSTTPTATKPSGAGSARFFEAEVRPLLVPVGLDPSHPFPQVANKSLNFIARLAGKDAFGRRNTVDDRQGAARAAAGDQAAALARQARASRSCC